MYADDLKINKEFLGKNKYLCSSVVIPPEADKSVSKK